MRKFYTILLLTSLLFSQTPFLHSQEIQESKTDQSSGQLSLNPEDIGSLENSINLFTGQVAFPMNLANVSDPSGMPLSVNIQYNSSGVNDAVFKSNESNPTSIVGLGWKLDYPKIIRDHKTTGAIEDDNFYLVLNGQSHPLIVVEQSNIWEFKIEQFPNRIIKFYEFSNKWEITNEDASTLIFGDDSNDRNTIQWSVRWGNWIGSSTNPDGQRRFASVYNLSEVHSHLGQKITYTYEVEEEYVANDLSNITSEKKHTRTSYIREIRNNSESKIIFKYAKKANDEYVDNHTEKSEPDAFQEKYQTKYLDRLEVVKEGKLDYEVRLDYELIQPEGGKGSKRTLNSIYRIRPDGSTTPPIRFEYSDASEEEYGMIKRVTNSFGAYYEYNYKNVEIQKSQLDFQFDVDPTKQEPKIYAGSDYIVVVQKADEASAYPSQKVMKIYQWIGTWKEVEVFAFNSISLGDNDYFIQLWEDHFYISFVETDGDAMLYVFSQESDQPLTWKQHSIRKALTSSEIEGYNPLFGENYAGIGLRTSNNINSLVRSTDGKRWERKDVDLVNDSYPADFYFGGGHNYIVANNRNNGVLGRDIIRIHYLDQNRNWKSKPVSNTQEFDSHGITEDINRWSGGMSFASVTPKYNSEFIYEWDESYGGFRQVYEFEQLADDSRMIFSDNSMFGMIHDRSFVGRFNGQAWDFLEVDANVNAIEDNRIDFNRDFFLDRTVYDSKSDLYFYDANKSAWNSPISISNPNDLNSYVNINDYIDYSDYSVHVGTDFVIASNSIYKIKHNGELDLELSNIQDPRYYGVKNIKLSDNFIAYEKLRNLTTSATDDPYIILIPIVDGELQNKINLGKGTIAAAGSDFIVYKVSGVTNQYKIKTIRERQILGQIESLVVDRIKWYDGNHYFYNAYKYNEVNATIHPQAFIPQFNKVSLYPGAETIDQAEFGRIDYYLKNSYVRDDMGPPEFTYILVPRTSMLNGVEYLRRIYDKNENLISENWTIYNVKEWQLLNEDEEVRLDFDVIREGLSRQKKDNVETETSYTYNDILQLKSIESSPKTYSIPEYATRRQKQEITYLWEINENALRSNYLNRTAQIKQYRSDKLTSSSVQVWEDQNGKFYPIKSYQWKKEGTGVFDFQMLSNNSDAEWRLVNEVTDYELADGRVNESKDYRGDYSARIYSPDDRVVAEIANSDLTSFAFTDFEEDVQNNLSYNIENVSDQNFKTGRNSFSGDGIESIDANLPAGKYMVSFWSSADVTVTASAIIQESQKWQDEEWNYHQFIVKNTGSISLIPQAHIDNISIIPFHSAITSYFYNDYGQLLSEANGNGSVVYYEYNNKRERTLIRDQNHNIIERREYTYRDQEEYRAGRLESNLETVEVDAEVNFIFNIPEEYKSEDHLFKWTIGEEVIETAENSISYTFSMAGDFKVSVRAEDAVNGDFHDYVYVNVKPSGNNITATASINDDQFEQCEERPWVQNVYANLNNVSGGCGAYTYQWQAKQGSGEFINVSTNRDFTYTIEYNIGDPYKFDTYYLKCIVTDDCGNEYQSNVVSFVINPDTDSVKCNK